jgi:hypothetical protein
MAQKRTSDDVFADAYFEDTTSSPSKNGGGAVEEMDEDGDPRAKKKGNLARALQFGENHDDQQGKDNDGKRGG